MTQFQPLAAHILTEQARARIIAILQAARGPLALEEVSRLAGLAMPQTKQRLTALVQEGYVKNRGREGYTYSGPKSLAEVQREARWMAADVYKGSPKSAPVRPGAGDAFGLPSCVNGVRVPRTREPYLISSRVTPTKGRA